MDGVLLIDKPAGMTSHDVVAAVRALAGGRARPGTRARSTRSPPACCSCWSGARRKSQRTLMELPKRYETVARLGAVSSTGDPEGEITQTGRAAARSAAAADGRDAPAPADATRR